MAAFPSNLKILIETSETPGSVVLRSEMERGVPKQRRIAADVLVTVPIAVIFFTKQQAADFETWFYGSINGGVDFFDWADPRTGTTVQARIVGGQLGPLEPLRTNYELSRRSMTLEYIRPGYEILSPGRHNVSPGRILSIQSDPGTYIDGAGVLQTAPANTARYEDGLLVVDGASENRMIRSEEIDLSTLTEMSAIANEGIAPDGTMTADRLIPSLANVSHQSLKNGSLSQLAGQMLTLSVHVKRSTGVRYVHLMSFSSQCSATFDLDTKIVVNTGSGVVASGVISLADFWVRVWVTCIRTVDSGTGLYFTPRQVSNSNAFAGDGVSGHLVWGAQAENGPLTSYIPTTTVAVSRPADLITVAV